MLKNCLICLICLHCLIGGCYCLLMSNQFGSIQREPVIRGARPVWGTVAPVSDETKIIQGSALTSHLSSEARLPLGLPDGPAAPRMSEVSHHGYSPMTRKKEKMEMPVCARVSVSKFRTLEIWCDNSFRKRSEVVGIVLDRVLEILEQQGSLEQPVEEFVRRLRADSSS